MEEFSKNIEDDSWFCFDLLNLTVIDLHLTLFDLKRFKTYATVEQNGSKIMNFHFC